MRTSIELVDAALAYVAAGHRVIAVKPGSNIAIQSIRSPFKTAKAVQAFWQKTPTTNIGLVTGGETGVVIDLDARHDGVNSFLSHCPDSFPDTRIVQTPGGYHLYFKTIPNLRNSNTGLVLSGMVGVDVRGDNTGYIVAPPSIRPDGNYTVLLDAPLAEMPTWLCNMLSRTGISAGMKIVFAKLQDEVMAIQPNTGQRHDVFLRIATILGMHVAGKSIAEDIAKTQFFELCALRNSDGKYALEELARLWQQGVDYGVDNPVAVTQADASIVWVQSQLPQVCKQAVSLLAKQEDIFSHMNSVVEVVEGEFGVRMASVKCNALRAKLTEDILWVQPKRTKDGVDYKPIAAPLEVSKVILEQNNSQLPVLDGFVAFPYAGTTHTGYNATSRLFLSLPKEWKREKMSAKGALRTFATLLQDFPFVSPTDFSAYIAMVLTCCFRPYIEGPVPLFLITSPIRGSGKGKLANIASLIATGHSLPNSTQAKTDEEENKRIFAFIRQGGLIYPIDEISRELSGNVLNAIVTSDVFQGRILGLSEVVQAKVRMVIIAMGNNVNVSGDLHRRVLPIHIDPKMEHPEYRDAFQYADIEQHVREHRITYMSAALALIEGKRRSLAKVGSFEKFVSFVAEALPELGIPDPMDALREHQEQEDGDGGSLGAFFSAWHNLWGDSPVYMHDLHQAIVNPGIHPRAKLAAAVSSTSQDLMEDALMLTPRGLSHQVRQYRNRICNELILQRLPRGARGFSWRMFKAGEEPEEKDGRPEDAIQ